MEDTINRYFPTAQMAPLYRQRGVTLLAPCGPHSRFEDNYLKSDLNIKYQAPGAAVQLCSSVRNIEEFRDCRCCCWLHICLHICRHIYLYSQLSVCVYTKKRRNSFHKNYPDGQSCGNFGKKQTARASEKQDSKLV